MIEQRSSQKNYRYYYGGLILAIVLFGQLGALHTPMQKFASAAMQNVAAISSMNAVVEPNQYNSLAQLFSEKDKQLTEREQELLLREQLLDAKYQEQIMSSKRQTLFVIAGATLILVLLIFANFYFDIKREEERERALLRKGETSPPLQV